MLNSSSTITVNGKTIGIDLEGYLLDPADWNHDVAQFLAAQEQLELGAHRWTVVNFEREFYESRQSVPEARFALKAMKETLGAVHATRKY